MKYLDTFTAQVPPSSAQQWQGSPWTRVGYYRVEPPLPCFRPRRDTPDVAGASVNRPQNCHQVSIPATRTSATQQYLCTCCTYIDGELLSWQSRCAASTGPSLPACNPDQFSLTPPLQALAGAWKEYETDGDDGKKKSYWHNAMSGETTWEKPDTNEGKPPPPPAPPAPPAKPAEPKEPAPVKKEREKDQWKQVRNDRGRKYWYNEKVGGFLAEHAVSMT